MNQIRKIVAKKHVINYNQIIKEIRDLNTLDIKKIINEEKDTIRKCLLCKKYLSSNMYSMLLEKHIKEMFNLDNKKNNASGDAVSQNGLNIEIKVSFMAKNGNCNIVQLRPHYNIDYYLIMFYDVYFGEYGEIYWILCEAKKIYELIPEYGEYSHGTIKKNGPIAEVLNPEKKYEYSLRPNLKNRSSKKYKLWNLLKRYSSNVYDINNIFSNINESV